MTYIVIFFFFQAEDGIRDLVRSRGLGDVYKRQAWNAACVLDQLGEADINESLVADAHRPEGLINARGAFGPDQWCDLRPERDEALDHVLALVTPAAVELRLERLEAGGQLPKLTDATLQNPTGTTTLMRSLSWTARLFGVQAPAVHVLPKVDGDLTPLPLGEGTAAAGIALASGLELPDLAFLWARVLAYLHPDHRLLVFYPTAPDVANLLLAATAPHSNVLAEGTVRAHRSVPCCSRALPPAAKNRLFAEEVGFGLLLEGGRQHAGARAELGAAVASVARPATPRPVSCTHPEPTRPY